MKITSRHVLWGIFIALLLVLLPHTAWFFAQFENQAPLFLFGYDVSFLNGFTPFAAAFAFEAAIAALVHRLSEHIEQVKVKAGNHPLWVRKAVARYVNIYSLALVIVTFVSCVANYAHAVEFGSPIKAFTLSNVSLPVYAMIAGGVLPFCSLLFARVLSRAVDTEQEVDPELERAKSQLRETEKKLRESEAKRTAAETKLGEYSGLLADDKKTKVLTARALWPDLAYSGIEVITGAKAGYISEVLNNKNGHTPAAVRPAGDG